MSANHFLERRADRLEESLSRLSEIVANYIEDNRLAMERSEKSLEEYKESDRLAMERQEEANRKFIEDYKRESKEDFRKLHRELGHISNKMGTIVEDLVYPAVRPLISRYYNLDINDVDLYSNVYKKSIDGSREKFDVIAVTPYKVFLIEVKSTLRDAYIKEYRDKAARFKDFFPEYLDKELILVIASLSMNKNSINLLTKNHILALAYREWDYMDFLNFKY